MYNWHLRPHERNPLDLEDLVQKPVFDIDNERFLGYVIGSVLDSERTRLLGIVTRTRFGRPKMVAPTSSIELLHADGLMVNKAGFRWLPLQRQIWSAARAQKKTGALAAVCNEETLGSVVDCTVNEDGLITHLIVQRGMVGKTRRIRRDKVLAIEEGVVLLADDALAERKPKTKPAARPKTTGLIDSAAAVLGRTLAQATHQAKKGARSSLIGKPAPWSVTDETGSILVAEGEPLTADALAAEASRGRTGELAGAVAGGALGRSLAKRRKKK